MTTHLAMPLEVTAQGPVVVVEPQAIYNVRAFTLSLLPETARALARVLMAQADVASLAERVGKL